MGATRTGSPLSTWQGPGGAKVVINIADVRDVKRPCFDSSPSIHFLSPKRHHEIVPLSLGSLRAGSLPHGSRSMSELHVPGRQLGLGQRRPSRGRLLPPQHAAGDLGSRDELERRRTPAAPTGPVGGLLLCLEPMSERPQRLLPGLSQPGDPRRRGRDLQLFH